MRTPSDPALPDMRCDDVTLAVAAYLDGELVAEDRALVDAHVAACSACKAELGEAARLKALVRAKAGPAPVAPAALRARILAGLDQVEVELASQPESDARPARPSAARRALPFVAVFAAAAAMTIFVRTVVAPPRAVASKAGVAMVEEFVRAHEKNLPVEVQGDPDQVRTWMQGKVPVAVRPPTLVRPGMAAAVATPRHEPGVPVLPPAAAPSLPSGPRLVGARLGRLSSRDAGELRYSDGRTVVTVHVFDASNLPLAGGRHRLVEDREIFVQSLRGYNVVYFTKDDVGYAFTSDLPEADLVSLVEMALR